MYKNTFLIKYLILYLPDIFILLFLFTIYFTSDNLSNEILYYFSPGIVLFIILKDIAVKKYIKYLYISRLKDIRGIISEFKKGRYIISKNDKPWDDELATVLQELITIGKYINDIISIQINEIKKFHEFYNNIVFSSDSYFIILNEKEKIIFINENFSKKFQFNPEEIIGKSINDVFIVTTDRIEKAISDMKSTNESILLEKTHLFSNKKISIIADIKITNIIAQGWEHVILIIDDITARCRKEYQTNLITETQELNQENKDINMNYYTILSGITSTITFGFNRAMLFLLEDNKMFLQGEMALCSDSINENKNIRKAGSANTANSSGISSKTARLLEKVINTSFQLESNNIFVKSFNNKEIIHVYDINSDERIDDDVRNFINVKEFVVAPLITENKAIGIITADNKDNQVPIGDDQVQFLSIFTTLAAILIDNSRNISSLKNQVGTIKKRQKSMVDSERLAAVGRVATHIAHEIRNPLVTMGGYARRIEKITEHNEEALKAADVIIRESKRLENILSNIMDYTRISSFIIEFNNINDAIIETTDLLKNLFQEKGIDVILKLNNKIPLVRSELNQIKQVIINLLHNAIDSSSPEGKIEIITDEKDGHVKISIGDNGSGIRDDHIGKIFEPFYTTKPTGMGLGLAIVNKIIKDHNGKISVGNKKNGGAEFSIFFPIPK